MRKYLLKKILPYSWAIVISFICIMFIGVIRQVFPAFFGWMIDVSLNERHFVDIIKGVVVYLILFLVSLLFHYAENMLNAFLYNNMLQYLCYEEGFNYRQASSF